METLDKKNLQKTFDVLSLASDKELDKSIDDAVGMLLDELRGYVEGLTCNSAPTVQTVWNSARLDYAFGNLKFLCGEKYHRNIAKAFGRK